MTGKLDAVLCYVDGDNAFFTTQPLDKQWGDDWNDAPYEHNAGDPYTFAPYMEERGEKPYEVICVKWQGPWETPAQRWQPNSQFSVEQINAGAVAWLLPDNYTTGVRAIKAGTTLREFVQIVESTTYGAIYFPRTILYDIHESGL